MTYVILIIALLAIVYGANWFVDGAVGVARKAKISDFVRMAAGQDYKPAMARLINILPMVKMRKRMKAKRLPGMPACRNS